MNKDFKTMQILSHGQDSKVTAHVHRGNLVIKQLLMLYFFHYRLQSCVYLQLEVLIGAMTGSVTRVDTSAVRLHGFAFSFCMICNNPVWLVNQRDRRYFSTQRQIAPVWPSQSTHLWCCFNAFNSSY